MNTRSIKFRLVAWYVGWLTVLFVIFGIFVYVSLSHYLEKALHEGLARRGRQVAVTAHRLDYNPVALSEEIPKAFTPEVNNRFSRVIVAGKIAYVSGRPADQSFAPEAVPFPSEGELRKSSGRRRLPDGTMLLIVMFSRTTPHGLVIVEEGSALTPLRETLHAWLAALVTGLIVLICGAAFGGALVVRQALRPVGQIIKSAELISSRNLNERLPVAETGDEIERLSVSLNGMIRRLDEGFRQTQRFFADASHELRTPLTIIQGELEAMVKNGASKPALRVSALNTLEETERLKRIVEGLMTLSRLDAGEVKETFEAVDLANLAATTSDQMCLLAEDKQVTILFNCGKPVVVMGDGTRLKQVLINLLANAINYTSPGGKIEVSVTETNGYGVLVVADNGIGIPPDALPHVFDRFFRVDKTRSRELGGAGLGLSIVKSICVAHNGQVSVQSDLGRGSRFSVAIPLFRSRVPS